MSKAKSLNDKIVAIMEKAQAIGKNGSNQHYDYVQAADVIREMKRHLITHGLRLKTEDVSDPQRTPCGKQTLVTLKIKYTLIDRETGEEDVTIMSAEGADVSDKAINKARTNGLKYYFRDLFLLDFADDAEVQPQPQAAPKQPKKSSRSNIANDVWAGLAPQPQPTAKAVTAKAKQALQSVDDDGKERRKFFALCKKWGITSPKSQKIIVQFYTGKTSRKDVTPSEYADINQVIPTITTDQLLGMAKDVMEASA